MKTSANLVEIVCSSHAPFHIVVSKDVVAVSEFCWVTIGLAWFGISSVNVGVGVEVNVVFTLGWSMTEIIEAWSNIFSETTSCHGRQ
jgi:hypothetical protein